MNGCRVDESAPASNAFGYFLVHEIHVRRVASLAFDQGQISSGLAGEDPGRRSNSKTYLLFGCWLPSCPIGFEKYMKVIISKTLFCTLILPLVLLSACGKKNSTPPPQAPA